MTHYFYVHVQDPAWPQVYVTCHDRSPHCTLAHCFKSVRQLVLSSSVFSLTRAAVLLRALVKWLDLCSSVSTLLHVKAPCLILSKRLAFACGFSDCIDIYDQVPFAYSIEYYASQFDFSVFLYLSSSSSVLGIHCCGRSYKNRLGCEEIVGQLYRSRNAVSLNYKNHLHAAGQNHSYFLYYLNFPVLVYMEHALLSYSPH